ncbi:hypothetical protein GINT2_001576 [Glugoides intestinalis]
MLKDFIDGAASNSEVLQQLIRLKILFYDDSGIRYINSAVEKLPSLVTSLPKLSEITIENHYPDQDIQRRDALKLDNLVKLIKELPKNRRIAINLIGRFIELKENQELVKALKDTPDTVKVSIVYNLSSFSKEDALSLKDTIEDPKLDIRILDTSNRIKRPIPISIAFLENLLKAKYFFIGFGTKEINVKHTSVKDFLSLFDFFLKELEWVRYTDKNPRTEICELLTFLKAFNTCEDLVFRSPFLSLTNKDAFDNLISEVNKRDKKLILDASALLIDSENLILFYNKMKGTRYFTLRVNSWLIRVRNENMGAFNEKFEEIYKKLYPEGLHQKEFLVKIEALSKLDAFTIDLKNKDILYIEDGNFHTVFHVLKTIKNRFKKVFIAKDAFTKDELYILREELRNGDTCTLEILTEESLSNPWITSQ